MDRYSKHSVPADLLNASTQFAAWRRSARKRARLPESLWDLAVRLAAKYGVHRTKVHLNLDYFSLKRRCSLADKPDSQDSPAFVELPTVITTSECVLELVDGKTCFRLHLKGYSAADIALLGRGLRDSR